MEREWDFYAKDNGNGSAGEVSLPSQLGQGPDQFLPTLPSHSWDFTLSLSWSDPDSQLRAGAKYLLRSSCRASQPKPLVPGASTVPPAAPGSATLASSLSRVRV